MNSKTSRVGVDAVMGGVKPYRTIRGRFGGISEKGNPLKRVGHLTHIQDDSDALLLVCKRLSAGRTVGANYTSGVQVQTHFELTVLIFRDLLLIAWVRFLSLVACWTKCLTNR